MPVTIRIFDDKPVLGRAAAAQAAAAIGRAIADRGQARILAGTGASQFEFLDALTKHGEIDWNRVEMFHLDEYVGMSGDHPASFGRYLRERLIGPTGLGRYHLLEGDKNPADVARRVGAAIQSAPIDCAFVGIGENGHLAFNDPPADFDTREPYVVVKLDEACRRQQVGEGWFKTFADVPVEALSISIQQILAAREIVCVVPGRAEGRGGEELPGGTGQSHGSSLDPADASQHDGLSGSRILGVAPQGHGFEKLMPASGRLRWSIAALLCLSSTLNYLDRQTLSVLAATIQRELHLTDVQYLYVTSSFLLSYTVMYAVSGRVIDAIGVRKGLMLFVTAWSIVTMLHGLTASLIGLAFFRFLLGATQPANFPAGVRAAAEWFPLRERALAVGIFNSGTAIGGALAAPIVSCDSAGLRLAGGLRGQRRARILLGCHLGAFLRSSGDTPAIER